MGTASFGGLLGMGSGMKLGPKGVSTVPSSETGRGRVWVCVESGYMPGLHLECFSSCGGYGTAVDLTVEAGVQGG